MIELTNTLDQKKKEYDETYEQLIRKDELNLKYEEDIQRYKEKIKSLQDELEMLDENQLSLIGDKET